MIDYRLLRNDPERVRKDIARRGYDPSMVDEWIDVDARWREATTQVETLIAEQNKVSKEIARLKKEGEDASQTIARMREVGDEIKRLQEVQRHLESAREAILLMLPNILHETVPTGNDLTENVEVKRWGQPKTFDFEPKAHWDIAERLKLIDFEAGAQLSGSGFVVYTGLGAALERAVINFMLDLHTRHHGYTELFTPFLVRPEIMVGTGQLPKFADEMYHLPDDDLYLIPTAEVPVTNMLRESILDAEQLPLYYAAYSACFRREAGSAGRQTRGLQRLHQFNKVELVRFTLPEVSYQEHEQLLHDAEAVLQRLGLAYRVMLLCSGDTGYWAAKCYDLEIWSPGVQQWLEVSSCSNFEDFQARRANIRFRREAGARPEFVHTLNASGVATPRLVSALLEQYQQHDGSILVPEPLRPYLGGLEIIQNQV